MRIAAASESTSAACADNESSECGGVFSGVFFFDLPDGEVALRAGFEIVTTQVTDPSGRINGQDSIQVTVPSWVSNRYFA